MRVWSRLVGLGRVEPLWRAVLPDLFAELAGPDGLVLDLRTPAFQSLGMPTGLADRTVGLRVDQYSEGGRRVGDVIAKRIRGEAAHLLLELDAEPDEPDAIADLLGEHWPVRLEAPERKGRAWTLSLAPGDE